MAPSMTKAAPGTTGKTFFGHPRGLATLFMTEMWERFSFYGLRALLVVYLVAGGPDAGQGGAGHQGGGLAMTLATATAIYSVYNAMVYLLTMPGGWFGDRLWGPRKTVTVGAGIIMIGHLTLALPGQASFFIGLACVATGSGLLKANISKMVGDLYNGPDDPRRDGGFTVFYMGINTGSFLAPFVIGTVGQTVSWHLGFGMAAVGMGLGLVQFLIGSRHLDPRSSRIPAPLTAQEKTAVLRKSLLWLVVAILFYGVVVATGTFTLNWAMVPLTVLGLLIPLGMLVRIKRDTELTRAEQGRMTGYIWFFAAAAIFWMIYDQGASTVQAFGDAKTSTQLFGWDFPSTWFQSINPLFIILLAPVFAALWLALNRRGREPTTTAKFAFSLAVMGLSFFLFVIPMAMASDGTKVSPLWLVLIFLLHTVAELCLSPVGLSVTTKLAPAKYASQLMGVWFLAVTAGDSITGLLSIGGVDLSTTGVVAMEATLSALAGFAVYMYRRQITATMTEVK
ncbi:MFS transporter [Streptomyces oryzae]|uniref:MFS transporter n=1 Tax=Streptomyces oryzae TaxID=1434886 RepID=A0ABS3X4Y7_9ACTN|nr:oligopeptide:H+ symporter [Streptomyces oryzae]MBO8190442.1 MFS transporter [Streptomyces oryzae]